MDDVRVSKITISLPPSLLKFADLLAREKSTSRSGTIAKLLEKEEEARTEALMAEGYLEMAEENLREAEEALNLTREVVLRNPGPE
jgi:metal-responsive CopG/Arc/MetJ family transcriptional regulator